MRILLINYEYPPVGGGGATATRAIAQSLCRAGHQVVVMTGRFGNLAHEQGEDGVVVHRIPSVRNKLDRSNIMEMFSFLVSGLFALPRIVRRHRIEGAIAFFSFPSGPIAWLDRILFRIPYVVSLRGGDVPGTEKSLGWIHRLLTPLRRAVVENAEAVVANSEGLQKLAEEADGRRVFLIPNAVDTKFFAPSPLPVEGDALQILFVGRLQKQKNLAFLMQQLARRGAGSFCLHLVGDGPEMGVLKTLARDLKIDSSIVWHGWMPREELRARYWQADCLVNPSLYEGLPNAVLEAMACGVPVVASNVFGNYALVQNGSSGFLFDLNRPDDLLDALSRLVDPDLRTAMSGAARRRALEFGSWDDVARQYVELFDARGQ